jgi:predicted PurR-regulated permease PerM
MVQRRRDAIWLLVALTAIALWLCYDLIAPFLRPLFAAIFVAIAVYPLHLWVRRQVPGENRPALITTLLALLGIVLPTIFFAQMAVQQGASVYNGLNGFIKAGGLERLLEKARLLPLGKIGLEVPTSEKLAELVQAHGEKIGMFGISAAGSLVTNAVGFLTFLVLTLFFLFFCLRDGEPAYRRLRILLPLTLEQTDRLSTTIHNTMAANVYGILAVALAQGGLTALSFLVLGVPHGILWGVVAGVLSVLPIIGATAVWLPGAIWLMATGSVWKGIVLLAFGFAVIANADNVVRPLVIQGKVQMNTLAVLISLLGGVAAFGLIGLFAGPVILTVTGELLKLLFEEVGESRREEAQATSGSAK